MVCTSDYTKFLFDIFRYDFSSWRDFSYMDDEDTEKAEKYFFIVVIIINNFISVLSSYMFSI